MSTGPLITRGEQKQRTRESLLDAALTLMQQGRGFTSLGLREITREAGVVPTSFYRHFRDLDELGLALVEEGGMTLRRLLREARKAGIPVKDILQGSVLTYINYLKAHPQHFMFIISERNGGSTTIRAAIRSEISHFINEMAQDIQALGLLPLSTQSLQMIAGLIVNTMLNAAGDILDLAPGRARAEQEMVDNFVRQLRLILLGATVWKEKKP